MAHAVMCVADVSAVVASLYFLMEMIGWILGVRRRKSF